MSWIDKISAGIIVTCGDGKRYEPHYILDEKSVEYNVAEFQFVNIEGTLVKRSKPLGRRFPIQLIFQGDDHLDVADAFEISAKDERPWNVFHPVYGNLTVQPTGLRFDPTGISLTKITCELIETISEDYPKLSFDPKDNSGRIVDEYVSKSVDNYGENVDPSNDDINKLRSDVDSVYSLGSESVKSGDQANAYFQLYNAGITAINNAASDASLAANFATQIIMAPSLFVDQVKSRLNLLLNQYETLTFGFDELLTPNFKKTYEMNAGSIISAMTNTAINPINGDYENTNDVLDVIEIIVSTHNSYIEGLNNLQTINGGTTDSYIPDFESVSQLNTTVGYVISNLMEIAISAKKERSHILKYDSNVILLTHRFYGITVDNSTIESFINQNGIELSEILQIKAGREIVYYV